MANKYIDIVSGKLTQIEANDTSAGGADAGKLVALDGAGLIDPSMLPDSEVVSFVSFENLLAGDYVNIFDDAGTAKARKADATTDAKPAHGYVLDAVTAPAVVNVYFEGKNSSALGSPSIGDVYLSTTAGQVTNTAPSGSGNIVQRLGVYNSSSVITEVAQPIKLA